MIVPIAASVESSYRFFTQIYRGMNYPKNTFRPLPVTTAFAHTEDYLRN